MLNDEAIARIKERLIVARQGSDMIDRLLGDGPYPSLTEVEQMASRCREYFLFSFAGALARLSTKAGA